MILKLDKRLAAKKSEKDTIGFQRKERVAGLPSTSQAPIGAPQWAVSEGNKLCYKLYMVTVSIKCFEGAEQQEFQPLTSPAMSASATPENLSQRPQEPGTCRCPHMLIYVNHVCIIQNYWIHQ